MVCDTWKDKYKPKKEEVYFHKIHRKRQSIVGPYLLIEEVGALRRWFPTSQTEYKRKTRPYNIFLRGKGCTHPNKLGTKVLQRGRSKTLAPLVNRKRLLTFNYVRKKGPMRFYDTWYGVMDYQWKNEEAYLLEDTRYYN